MDTLCPAWRQVFALSMVLGISLLASHASAQSSTAASAEPLIFPRLMASFGVGTTGGRDGELTGTPLQTVGVQFLVTRHLAIEGDVSFWNSTWSDTRPGGTIYSFVGTPVGFSGNYFSRGSRKTWSTGVNLLFRSEPRRVSTYFGGGPVFGSSRQRATFGSEGCTALPAYQSRCPVTIDSNFDKTETGPRAVAGVDVLIAHGIRAYGDFQSLALSDAVDLRFTAGVRVDVLKQSGVKGARTRADRLRGASGTLSASSVAGKKVRVTFAGGKQMERTFVELSSDELVLAEHGQPLRYPLDQVLIVETAHHSARKGAIIGAIGGFLIGYLGSCGGGDEEICWPEVGALFGAIGAGAGAAIGAGIDRASALAHVVYVAPRATASTVSVAPLGGAGRAGATLALTW